MLDILRSLRSLLKISRIHTDGNIFRLHYSLTVIILMAFCIIITTKQYVGEPIDCLRADGVDKSIINTYCWIHTTYSIPRAFNKKVGVDVSILPSRTLCRQTALAPDFLLQCYCSFHSATPVRLSAVSQKSTMSTTSTTLCLHAFSGHIFAKPY